MENMFNIKQHGAKEHSNSPYDVSNPNLLGKPERNWASCVAERNRVACGGGYPNHCIKYFLSIL